MGKGCDTSITEEGVLRSVYNINNDRVILRLAGAGYRVLSRLNSQSMGNRWQRILSYIHRPDFADNAALEWWLSGGKPMDPYLRGALYSRLLDHAKPKELRLPEMGLKYPCMISENEQEFLERSVIRNWVAQWLKWVHWFSKLSADYTATLSDVIDVPVVETRYYRRNVDTSVSRFGIVFRLRHLCINNRVPPPLALTAPLDEQRELHL